MSHGKRVLCAIAAMLVVPVAAVTPDGGQAEIKDSAASHGAADASTKAINSTSRSRTITTSTTTTTTTTTSTITITTTTTTTTTTNAHVYGGDVAQSAFEGWFGVWRDRYQATSPCGFMPCIIPEAEDSLMPQDLRTIQPKAVISTGGDVGVVVSQGMGYGIMFEGFEAASGDKKAIENGLALIKGWLGMVHGPEGLTHPLAGGAKDDKVTDTPKESLSATKVNTWPYGVSAIYPSNNGIASGLATWQYPLDMCGEKLCTGSATDGDQDAVLGMIYIAAKLGYPADFVDMVMRALISFASADFGFPDLYRTLPGGEHIFVPKGGSNWGGLLPSDGPHKSSQQPWCYSPSLFAPAHYRAFRDFAKAHWQPGFNAYLPPHLDGSASTLEELTAAFDSAVVGGYNILYRSSCPSGSVSNWVGVEAKCAGNKLNCPGVPWAHTPFVGADKGECNASGTAWGSYGYDANRVPWRIAMDYVLYREESASVTMYDTDGRVDTDINFSAQVYLNRIVNQYKTHAKCDGGQPGECLKRAGGSPWKLAPAFDPKNNPPDVTCPNVPNKGKSWWVASMSYPTFAAFVAPFAPLIPEENTAWMDTLANICSFGSNKTPTGDICSTKFSDNSQAVISTMIMAGHVLPLPSSSTDDNTRLFEKASATLINGANENHVGLAATMPTVTVTWGMVAMIVLAVIAGSVVLKSRGMRYTFVSPPRTLTCGMSSSERLPPELDQHATMWRQRQSVCP